MENQVSVWVVVQLLSPILSGVVAMFVYFAGRSNRHTQRENERTEGRVNELWREFNMCRRDCTEKRDSLRHEMKEDCKK